MPSNDIPGANSHLISLTTAVDLTTTYRANRNSILQTDYQNEDILPLSETFNKNDIELLLAQDNCEALRIYYGMDSNLKLHAVIVAVNEDNEDILPSTGLNLVEDIIIEEGQRCPIICPPESPLNS
ncbi:MAG: hypothetical protein ABI685_12785 [Ferruginibacter sp.]